jgi:pSer/pThr/pTyr-binding forkhead associated (FHA) protein
MDDQGRKTVYLLGRSGPYSDQKFPLEGEQFSIGRAPHNNLVLSESTISGTHAKIIKTDGGYQIQDLDSTNGTFVNGVKIVKKFLRQNDLIKLDVIEFTFVNPMDVSRTEMARPDGEQAVEETVFRPPGTSGEGSPPTQIPSSPLTSRPRPRTEGGKGRPVLGLLVGLLSAVAITLGGLLASALIQAKSTTPALLNLLKNQISLFPIYHLHTTWSNMPNWTAGAIIAVVCLPLGPILAGAIAQNMGRGSRAKSAFLFSLLYVLLVLAAQLWVLDFDWSTLRNLSAGSGLGISPPDLNVAAVTAYFWAVSLVLAFIGTLLGRRQP